MSVLQKHSTLQILVTDSHGTQQNMPIMQTNRHLSMPTVQARSLPPHMQLDKEGHDPVMISCSSNCHSTLLQVFKGTKSALHIFMADDPTFEWC